MPLAFLLCVAAILDAAMNASTNCTRCKRPHDSTDQQLPLSPCAAIVLPGRLVSIQLPLCGRVRSGIVIMLRCCDHLSSNGVRWKKPLEGQGMIRANYLIHSISVALLSITIA